MLIKRSAMSATMYSEKISYEIFRSLKLSTEEELYIVLTKILCMS